jgi:hypothetical protein
VTPAELDPIAAGTLAWLEHYLARAVDTGIWDAPPELSVITRREFAGGLLHAATPAHLGMVWPMAPVPNVLQTVARALRMPDSPPLFDTPPGPGWDIFAVALFTEGWTFDMERDDYTDEHRRELAKWTRTHQISDHPERVEMKMLTAADRAGLRYSVQHHRGADSPGVSMVAGPDQVGGRVPEALDDILAALLEIEA